MAMRRTQISADVSVETKQRFDRLIEGRGLKKGYVIEQAMLHYMQMLDEIPAQYIIPPRITVTAETHTRIMDQIENHGEPTPAMQALMAGDVSQIPDDL